jgi:predicted ferric reductase
MKKKNKSVNGSENVNNLILRQKYDLIRQYDSGLIKQNEYLNQLNILNEEIKSNTLNIIQKQQQGYIKVPKEPVKEVKPKIVKEVIKPKKVKKSVTKEIKKQPATFNNIAEIINKKTGTKHYQLLLR